MSAPQQPVRSGLYRTPADIERVKVSLEASGVAWLDVPLQEAADKTELIRCIAQGIGVRGATFGENWDALADVLQDFSWRPANGYAMHLRQADSATSPPLWTTLRKILHETAIYWKSRGKPFVVFVDGDNKLDSWS